MDDFTIQNFVVEFEMGNVQIAHGLNRERQRSVGGARLFGTL